jgi:peptidylprolyl isomerase
VRFFALLGAVLPIAAGLSACGGGEGTSPADELTTRVPAAEIGTPPLLEIGTQRGPPPRQLVVRDLRQGTGAVMRRGDSMLIRWTETPYGEPLETTVSTWKKPTKFPFENVLLGWEEGMPGMRVGGSRELIVPPRLGDVKVDMIYVIELLGIERG